MDKLKSDVVSLSLQIAPAEAEGFSRGNHEKDREDPRVLRAEHQWDEEIGAQTDLPGLPEGVGWPSRCPATGPFPWCSELQHSLAPFAASAHGGGQVPPLRAAPGPHADRWDGSAVGAPSSWGRRAWRWGPREHEPRPQLACTLQVGG